MASMKSLFCLALVLAAAIQIIDSSPPATPKKGRYELVVGSPQPGEEPGDAYIAREMPVYVRYPRPPPGESWDIYRTVKLPPGETIAAVWVVNDALEFPTFAARLSIRSGGVGRSEVTVLFEAFVYEHIYYRIIVWAKRNEPAVV